MPKHVACLYERSLELRRRYTWKLIRPEIDITECHHPHSGLDRNASDRIFLLGITHLCRAIHRCSHGSMHALSILALTSSFAGLRVQNSAGAELGGTLNLPVAPLLHRCTSLDRKPI